MAWWFLLCMPPLLLRPTAFLQLYLTYLVTRSVAPDVLGDVAARPAAFAALIGLVATPVQIALAVAYGGRALMAALTGGEPPPPSAHRRWRRFSSELLTVMLDLGAALIVFAFIADPGDTRTGPLLAVTVLGPIAQVWLLKGLGALRRWGWRRFTKRGYQPRHAATEDVVGVS